MTVMNATAAAASQKWMSRAAARESRAYISHQRHQKARDGDGGGNCVTVATINIAKTAKRKSPNGGKTKQLKLAKRGQLPCTRKNKGKI